MVYVEKTGSYYEGRMNELYGIWKEKVSIWLRKKSIPYGVHRRCPVVDNIDTNPVNNTP